MLSAFHLIFALTTTQEGGWEAGTLRPYKLIGHLPFISQLIRSEVRTQTQDHVISKPFFPHHTERHGWKGEAPQEVQAGKWVHAVKPSNSFLSTGNNQKTCQAESVVHRLAWKELSNVDRWAYSEVALQEAKS